MSGKSKPPCGLVDALDELKNLLNRSEVSLVCVLRGVNGEAP